MDARFGESTPVDRREKSRYGDGGSTLPILYPLYIVDFLLRFGAVTTVGLG